MSLPAARCQAQKYRSFFSPNAACYAAYGGGVDTELKEALGIADGGGVFTQDFFDKYELVKETYSTKKNPNADELAKNRKKELQEQGFLVKMRKVSFEDLARSVGYFIIAVKRKNETYAKGSTVKGGEYKFGYDITLKKHTSKNGTDIELRQNPKTKYYTIFVNGFGGTSTPTEFLHVAEDDYKYELSKYESLEKRGVFAKGSTVKGKRKTAEEIYEEEQHNAMFNSEFRNGGGVGSDETPKVWVGEWSLYNEGKLIGEWVDLSDYSSGEEVMDKIQELLDKWTEETGENREEYGIFDFENFPRSMYSEQMGEQDFDNVIKAWEFSQDRDVPMEVIGNIVSEYEPSDLEEWFDEHYEGQFDSDRDLAYHYVDVLGGIERLGKDTTERYFDYESFGRDLAYDYNNYDGHYFRSYKRGGNINKFDLKNYLTKGGFNYTIGGL